MKKLLLLLCALALLCLPAAQAQTAYTAACYGVPVMTVVYDEAAFSLDTESYLGSTFGPHIWLGMFYNGSYTVEMAADLYNDLPANCDQNQLSAYLQNLLGVGQCVPLEPFTGLGQVPFVIFSVNTPAGAAYYAATLVQGYVIHFEIYNLRGGVDANALGVLQGLLYNVYY